MLSGKSRPRARGSGPRRDADGALGCSLMSVGDMRASREPAVDGTKPQSEGDGEGSLACRAAVEDRCEDRGVSFWR